MMKVFRLFSYLVLAAMVVSTTFLSSCGKDEPSPVPTITLSLGAQSAYTLTDGKVEGDIGADITINIEIDAPGGFQSMTITEFQGNDEIGSETFETEQATYSHVIADDDFFNPFRVKVDVTDGEGQTSSANVVISVATSNLNKLLAYSWMFTSQIYPEDVEGGTGDDFIADCEKDNFYTFYADGSLEYNFGAINGMTDGEGGTNCDEVCGGTCAFDGTVDYQSWTFDEETEVLTVIRYNPETEMEHDRLIWTIRSFGDTQFTGRIDYDFFGSILTLDETFIAIAKSE